MSSVNIEFLEANFIGNQKKKKKKKKKNIFIGNYYCCYTESTYAHHNATKLEIYSCKQLLNDSSLTFTLTLKVNICYLLYTTK